MENKLSNLNIAELFREQLLNWDLASANYDALKSVKTKQIEVNGFPFKIQFNPARIVSSAAKVDPKSIQERKCFLCEENRPTVQRGIKYNHYSILINPFPIFPKHLTIPLVKHQDQLIKGKIGDMIDLCVNLYDYTLFYNGPKCGASAPDHFHFQAGNKGFLPIETELNNLDKDIITSNNFTTISAIKSGINGVIAIESTSKDETVKAFNNIYNEIPVLGNEGEPMLNILCWFDKGKITLLIYLRTKHRPSHYFAEGVNNILLSPASVDLGGVFITPLEKDFEKITESQIIEILDEVLLSYENLTLFVDKLKTLPIL